MKNKKTILLSIFLVFICLGASFNPISCKTDVSGRVTDGTTGAAIEGASVSIKDHPELTPVATNENGEYTINDLVYGDYTMVVSIDGYDIFEQEINSAYFNNSIACEEIDGNVQLDKQVLVAFWKMDYDENPIRDSSGNENTGEMPGYDYAPTFTSNGKLGGAYIFNKDEGDYISIPKKFSFVNGDSVFSIALWVYPTCDTEECTALGIPYGNYQWFVTRTPSGSDVAWSVKIWSDMQYFYFTNNLGLDTWSHIVITCDGNRNAKVYLNGQLDNTITFPEGWFGNSANHNTIGCNRPGGENPWDGMIDEVAIWNEELSEEEVLSIYDNGVQVE